MSSHVRRRLPSGASASYSCNDLERALLSNHAVFTETETARRFLSLMKKAKPEVPTHRGDTAPGHLTASAFVLDSEQRSLLLIRHPTLERWLQPGGHIEPGELDLRASARREVLEETGFSVASLQAGPVDLDVHRIPENTRKGESEHDHYDVRFLFQVDPSHSVAAHEDIEQRWVPLEDVSSFSDDASVIRVVQKLLRGSGGGA